MFQRLSKNINGTNNIARLDIALEIPGVLSHKPRSRIFSSLQHLLANVYKLFCAVSAAKRVELDGPGGIDARVIFVDSNNLNGSTAATLEQGPIISLQTLALSDRPWDSIFYLQSTRGQKFVREFITNLGSPTATPTTNTLAVPGGQEESTGTSGSFSITNGGSSQPLLTPNYSVAVGGTFDHIHVGHKLLLTATALALDPIQQDGKEEEALMTIGVTGDELLVNKKYAEVLEDWDKRCHSTASFLTSIMDFSPPGNTSTTTTERVFPPGPNGKYVLVKLGTRAGIGTSKDNKDDSPLTLKLVQISDAFGPTITDKNITAIVVSEETRAGGKAINDVREKKGWKGLEVFEIDVLFSGDVAAAIGVDAESFGSKISSTDIRRHRVDMAKTKGSL